MTFTLQRPCDYGWGILVPGIPGEIKLNFKCVILFPFAISTASLGIVTISPTYLYIHALQ